MFEGAVVFGIVGLLVGVAVLDAVSLMVVGGGIATAGLLASVGTGWVYHARLRAALARDGMLPRWWWLAPTRLHGRVQPGARGEVFPWFRAGLLCMAVHGLGLAIFTYGALVLSRSG